MEFNSNQENYMAQRKILIIFTGGTIASVKSENGLIPGLNAPQILEFIPEIPADIEIETLQLCNLDSTDVYYKHWLMISEAIERYYEGFDGFVICHGTDTLAYTAAALSYLIQNSPKPIVLTGSQKPIGMEITDAKKNLMDSILYAADPDSNNVNVVFYGKVIAGTRAKKNKSFSFDAFASINYPSIASVQNNGKIIRFINEPVTGGVKFYHSLDPKVFVLKLTPGITSDILETLFEQYDCIIIESFGVGGIPINLIDDLGRLKDKYAENEKIIIMATQVTYEGSDIATYEVGQRIQNRFRYLQTYDMTLEAAFTKIMWILGNFSGSFHDFHHIFKENINHDILNS